MSDSSHASSPYLEIAVEQKLGELSLIFSCSLSAPWTVLFGPSGAGKTSILRILGGLAKPRQGYVIFRGSTLIDTERGIWVPAGRRNFGYVPQQPSLFPHMDVAANVAFGLHGLSSRARQERVAQMLQLFHIEPLAGHKPGLLSGGEKQRVALARALAPAPQMLLLDEPFSGLDASLKESILEDLSLYLNDGRVPALYVSHDLAEVFQTGADVIVLDHGRLQAQGAPEVVLRSERERLLRQLGASSP